MEEIPQNEKSEIHRYTLKDGTIYEVPFNKQLALQSMATELIQDPSFTMPQSADGIGKMCRDMIKKMRLYLELKELHRYTSSLAKMEGKTFPYSESLKGVLDYSKESIEGSAELAAKLAPAWYGHDVPGVPHYYGGNPNNIFGVDHKYDYLLKPEQRYIARERDLIYGIAASRKPYIPSEATIYNSSEMSNIAKATIIEKRENDPVLASTIEATEQTTMAYENDNAVRNMRNALKENDRQLSQDHGREGGDGNDFD
ncbi:MAG: hypothetical protein IJ217_04500 [Clostridia bacterium]|nr:hypothetical protein [Clostridia bacterium]